MATKDDRPGLLSKVAMFVRNPTRDWTELDQSGDGDAAGYDKQALKAMIERKRQNDFVRKREFDQLRKLRNRDPVALASMARPSFFQTSLGTDLEERAVTLKKIDEIEAQMSRQWWKARGQDSQQAATVQGPLSEPPGELPKGDSAPYQGAASDMSLPFASTEPMVRGGDPADDLNDFMPTMMSAGDAAAKLSGADGGIDSGMAFSGSSLLGFDADEMQTDPDLEEAAIRFANGDNAGAEGGLLTALRSIEVESKTAQAWAAALLDLYRATGNRKGFDSAGKEFVQHLDGIAPVWVALGGSAVQDGAEQGSQRTWNAPAQLAASHVEDFRAAMASKPAPWHVGWAKLQAIAPDAMPLLETLFADLCTQTVSLRFDGHEYLVRALRNITPSGERQVERGWWIARLNALRAMDLQDEFELAALDYCITFEVAPREWAPAACRIEINTSTSIAGELRSDFGTVTAPMVGDVGEDDGDLLLQGEIVGDATPVLAALEEASLGSKRMRINCTNLVRVDFAAAGSLLNWVSTRQSEGTQVHLLNVNRLAAAFFYVIGINEYAKVIPRAM